MHQQNNGFLSTGSQAEKPVSFLLNGKAVECRPDETILEAAQKHGVEIMDEDSWLKLISR